MSADGLCGNLTVFTAALGGFILLALAMERQGEWLLHHVPTRRQRLFFRMLGGLLLCVALALCLLGWGWRIGPIAWLGWLSLAGVVLGFSLPYWPWTERQTRHRHTPPRHPPVPPSAKDMSRCPVIWRLPAIVLLIMLPLAYLHGVWQAIR